MGIVVTLGMLDALILLVANMRGLSLSAAFEKPLAVFVLLCGLWNTFWYGMQHLQQFWGLVAVGSGVAMIIAACVLLAKYKSPSLNVVLTALLGAFFVLYTVTIVQLNLGLQIIS